MFLYYLVQFKNYNCRQFQWHISCETCEKVERRMIAVISLLITDFEDCQSSPSGGVYQRDIGGSVQIFVGKDDRLEVDPLWSLRPEELTEQRPGMFLSRGRVDQPSDGILHRLEPLEETPTSELRGSLM